MTLLERFLRWATSWWWHPTIDAMQSSMLKRVWYHYERSNRCLRPSADISYGRGGGGGETIWLFVNRRGNGGSGK